MKFDSIYYDMTTKITLIIAAILGSKALQEFFVSYDWGHSLFGILGFIVGWAILQVEQSEHEAERMRYWVAKLLLSLILPVFMTNYIAAKIGFDHIFVAFVIGIFPDLLIFAIKKFINKKTDEI